jgi:hypothetical protein
VKIKETLLELTTFFINASVLLSETSFVPFLIEIFDELSKSQNSSIGSLSLSTKDMLEQEISSEKVSFKFLNLGTRSFHFYKDQRTYAVSPVLAS